MRPQVNMDMLPPEHVRFIKTYPTCYCLQPDYIPFSEALWLTPWGAHTLDNALIIERTIKTNPVFSHFVVIDIGIPKMSHAFVELDEKFIDDNGFSQMLD